MSRLWAPRRTLDDGGFGLIETVVALLIAGIVFGALATTLISAVQASLFGRQNQQATDFMTRELELMRTLDYGSIAMDSGDLGGDARLSGCGVTQCLDVNGAVADGLEPVITATVGGVNPHTTVLTGDETNNTPFTVSRYVTEMADQPTDQAVRATVYVTWMNKGTVHTRSTSTIIAYTQRGLPLPVFKLELPIASLSVNPGGTLTYNLTLTNQGAPDRWNLTLSGATSGWWLYADSDPDGVFDPSVDVRLTDTTLDGVDDTGRIDPSSTFRFFLTRDTTLAEALGDSTTTVTATSSGQPSATGATKFVVATSTVTTGPVLPPPGPTPTPTGPPVPPEVSCAAPVFAVFSGMHHTYTQRQYTLHNDGVGDTLLQPQMYFNAVWGDEPNLAHYSTDVDPGLTGRVLAPAGATMRTGADVLTLTDPTRFADWSNTYNQKTDIDGTGILRLWVAPQGAGASSMKVVLYMAATASASRTLITEIEVPLVLTCAGFQEVYLQLPDVPQPEVAKNGVLGVRVVTAGAENVRLAYDVPSQFPSSFTIGTRP